MRAAILAPGRSAPRNSELTIDVSEDDLRTFAERGYEGAPHAPTTISRRKRSACFSRTPSWKPERLNSCCGVTLRRHFA